MKRIIFVLMASMALCSLTLAQNKTIAVNAHGLQESN